MQSWLPFSMKGLDIISIHFDGGCRPSNPGNKYGSYEILLCGRSVKVESRVELGYGTNNEAEFNILIRALDWTLDELDRAGFSPKAFSLWLHTDSTIVRNRLLGRNQTIRTESQRRMQWLADDCLALIRQFGHVRVDWNGRELNVARFGH